MTALCDVMITEMAKGKPLDEALSSIAGSYESVWTYNAAISEWERYVVNGPPSLNNLKTMAPGKGYWIRAIADCTWTIPHAASSVFKLTIQQ